jgi:F-type H+-transporting ATPase subunit delta
MNQSKISVRYAKALFGLVKETQTSDILRKDIELLLQCIRELPDLQYVIQSPVIKVGEKIRLFEESFRDTFHSLAFTFINLVLKHRREEHLAGMCRYFLDLLKSDQGIRSAELVTTIAPDEKLRQQIIRLISRKYACQVELQEKVDKAIVGGFILRVDDQQIDASISSKLKRIKTELINSQF